jgi:FtsP/CotA-like multicopper oxidase with cupredoxin domain
MTSGKFRKCLLPLALAAAGLLSGHASAAVYVQCPGDINGDGDRLDPGESIPANHPNSVCKHLTAGDGFIKMADGYLQYMFGFSDITGTAPGQALQQGSLAANFPAPTIALKEGEELYLTLTNVAMVNRPDLFDPHSVHFHGFPQAAPVFDGVPEASIVINQGSSFTYYYNVREPGTFMYHCHVEATEHMQMGMLGNLYVDPIQNRTGIGGTLASPNLATKAGKEGGAGPYGYVYNDGDGSTAFDVEVALQLGSFDHNFHDASMNVQPLPFALMKDTYAMINGRGYPDTVNPAPLAPPVNPVTEPDPGKVSQKVSSLVTATSGQKVLLRLSNLSVTNLYTVTALGLPMKVVGAGAAILRGPDPDGSGDQKGKNLFYQTASVTLGGGESADVIVDTAGVPAGTYFLYTTNLNYLSNNADDFGGMMSEIVIN